MGTYWKVSKNVVFSPQERGEKRGWEIIRAWSENAATGDYFARFPPLSMPFFTRWDWKCGQYNRLCKGCVHPCKQSFRAVVLDCPHFQSQRVKKGMDKGGKRAN